MALLNAYCTVQQVRDQLSDKDGRVDDSMLERAINTSSRAIDRACGRRFWLDAVATTRTFRADDPELLWIEDIGARTGVAVATDPAGDGTFGTSWSASEFELGPRNADVVAAGDTLSAYAFWTITAIGTKTFPHSGRRASVRVTGRFGWSAVPEDITVAAILQSVGLFKRKDAPFGVAGFGEFGAVRIARRDSDVWGLISPFIRITAAGLG